MATYYVRPSGSTPTAPYDTWNKAYNGLPDPLERGSTYVIAGGSYSAYTFNDAVSGTSVITLRKASQTSSRYGYTDETVDGWQDAFETDQAVWPGWTISTGYYTFNGVTGQGPEVWPTPPTGHGFKVYDSTIPSSTRYLIYLTAGNITITKTEMLGTYTMMTGGNAEIFINCAGNIQYLTMSHCYAHHLRGAQLFSHWGGNNYLTVEYNYFYDNGQRTGGDPTAHYELWSGGSTNGEKNIVFRYNFCRDHRSTGILMMMNPHSGAGLCENWDVYGNVFWQENPDGQYGDPAYNDIEWDTGQGWLAGIDGSGMNFTNFKVYNNTIVGMYCWYGNLELTTGGSGNLCRNNIWFKNWSQWIGSGSNATGTYNWAYGNKNNRVGPPYGTSTDSQIGSGTNVVGTQDPFVDSANGDFRLKSSIAADDALRNGATGLGNDRDGNPFNVDAYGISGNSRGAYQFSPQRTLFRP